MKKLLIALAGVSALALPAAANADVIITRGTDAAIPANNDFKTDLANLGYTDFTSTGATITLTEAQTLTFYFLGTENAYVDTFTAGSVTYTETNTAPPVLNLFPAGTLIGSGVYGSGPLAALFTSLQGTAAPVGSPGFAIFFGPNNPLGRLNPITNGGSFYIGYDDQITGDDNHDDMIIRVDVGPAVPEPATWAMMLTGFAAAGIALRRRRRRTAQLPQLA